MIRTSKSLSVLLLVAALLVTMIPSEAVQANPSLVSVSNLVNDASDPSVKEEMEKAITRLGQLAQDAGDPERSLDYALIELRAAIDGNFESDNAVRFPKMFQYSRDAVKRLDAMESFPHTNPELQKQLNTVIDHVLAANRLAAAKLAATMKKNIGLFQEKTYERLLDKSLKDIEKGESFEDKNNREQALHFYEKGWESAQEIKQKGKEILDRDGDDALNSLEEKLGLDPDKLDTDGDGLRDGFELLKSGSDPLKKATRGGLPDGDADLDGDGVSNLKEQKAATSPVSKDTDGDGLNDGDETNDIGSSPLLKDTDVDGLNDLAEFGTGSNPNERDSDDDRIWDGLDTHLYTVTDEASGVKVEITAEGGLSDSVRIRDVTSSPYYRNISGSVSKVIDFQAPGNIVSAKLTLPYDKSAVPDGDVGGVKMYTFDKEKKALIPLADQGLLEGHDALWGSTKGSGVFVLLYAPLWEKVWNQDDTKAETSAPIQALADQDTDGDGLSDRLETDGMLDMFGNLHKTDPKKIDTDGDGLSDGEETGQMQEAGYFIFSSDPNLADTDADGLTDYEENDLETYAYDEDTDLDQLKDGEEIDLGYDPFDGNADGDSYGDKEELAEDTDPFFYDKIWYDYLKDILSGAAVNDYGETLVEWGWMDEDTYNSVGYLAGQLLAGYLVYGDVVDFVAGLTQEHYGSSVLAAAGLVPLLGDGSKTVAKIVQFARRTTKNLPKAYRIILQELENHPKLLEAALDAVSNGASKTLRKMGASDKMIAQLGRRANDLAKLGGLAGLRFADEALTAAQKTIIEGRIQQFWGNLADLSKKDIAEAFATEAAIYRYEQQGYTLLYAQRKQNRTVNTVTGPDIIMKTPSGEPFIIEAKGSYTTKGSPEMSDGRRRGVRLASKVDGQFRLYLSRDWLTTNRERYMDAFEDAILNNRIGQGELEAYNMLRNILDNGGAYKASVVFGGYGGSKIRYGSKIDEYAENLLNDVDFLDIIQILG